MQTNNALFGVLMAKLTSEVYFKKEDMVISYLNVYNYRHLRKRGDIIEKVDFFTFDGFLLKKICEVLLRKKFKRQAPDFGSYFKLLFDYLDESQESLYLIGGNHEEIQGCVSYLKENYKNLNVVGFRDGYFKEHEADLLMDEIKQKRPNKILLGVGTPKQEHLALQIKSMYLGATIFPCGAFISQTASKGTEYYPKWMNRYDLRWLYRIWKEPKLFKRYILLYPMSIFLFIFDFLKFKVTKSS